MSVKIMHKPCGAQIGWYLRDNIISGDKLRSRDYMRLDGTQPAYGEKFNEKCPSCGKKIQGAHEMVRIFDNEQ